MDRPRLIRGLRIAWSVWWGILCVLLIVLWVRIYWWTTYIVGRMPASLYFQVSLMPGTFGISIRSETGVGDWAVIHTSSEAWMTDFESQQAFEVPIMGKRWSRVWGAFYFRNGKNVPYWFLMVISAAVGAAPWLPLRFSLRTLLIATTLIAGVLATAAYMRFW
jgi:hypothetical protein